MFKFFDNLGKEISGTLFNDRFTPDSNFSGEVYNSSGERLGYSSNGSSVSADSSNVDTNTGAGIFALLVLFVILVVGILSLLLKITIWIAKNTDYGIKMLKKGDKVGWIHLSPLLTILAIVVLFFTAKTAYSLKKVVDSQFHTYQLAFANRENTSAKTVYSDWKTTPDWISTLNTSIKFTPFSSPYEIEGGTYARFILLNNLALETLVFSAPNCDGVNAVEPHSVQVLECVTSVKEWLWFPAKAINTCVYVISVDKSYFPVTDPDGFEHDWKFCATGYVHSTNP